MGDIKRTGALTGAASGIGAALAAYLMAEGPDVIGLDVRDGAAHVTRFIPPARKDDRQ